MNLPIEKVLREIVQQELEPLKNLLNQLASSNGGHTFQKLLTTDEAAAYLSVSPKWLVGQRCAGGGPEYIKMNKRYVRYRLEDLMAFSEKGVRKHTADPGGNQ